jgi:aspartate carbamoyltransferase catalytic subunit
VEVFPPSQPQARRHLISVADLDRDDVERILTTAESFEAVMHRDMKKVPTLRGRTVMTVFFESSTRTSSSFELAAKRLSADVVSLKAAGSSVDKGESLRDTIQTLSAYDPDVIVIRHAAVGAAARVTQSTAAHVVNAGDGCHQHPTQCLLDLYTIRAVRGTLDSLHVAIVGDVTHSRVARSNIQGLLMLGARVTLVGPPTLIPRHMASLGVEVSHDISAIAAADVIYVLRMQHERMAEGEAYVPSLREYSALWGVTSERVRPGQLVMHPGPMNRGVEISSEVADGPSSHVIDQVRAGLVVRMAVLYDLLAGPGPTDASAALRPVPAAAGISAGQEVA